jgi:hypothetical protein
MKISLFIKGVMTFIVKNIFIPCNIASCFLGLTGQSLWLSFLKPSMIRHATIAKKIAVTHALWVLGK